MVRVVDMTLEEKREMYMKQPKEKIVDMLIESNRILDIALKELKKYSRIKRKGN